MTSWATHKIAFTLSIILSTALISFVPSANAATYDWDFTSTSSGLSASGEFTVNASDDVTSLSGNVGGQAITFYTNPNFPSTATYHGVPNTGGADYIYDDYFNYATNAVSIYGILMSVGSGTNEVFYDLSVDNGPPSSSADLFSITKSGDYVTDEGTLSSNLVATPLPSSWSLMFSSLICLGLFAYRRKKLGQQGSHRQTSKTSD